MQRGSRSLREALTSHAGTLVDERESQVSMPAFGLCRASSSARITLLFALVLLGVTARLYHANSFLLELHSGRQYDTAAIARNFYEHSMDILSPQVDWGGNGPGYAETEFQIYAYLVAVLYKLFGVHEVLGRFVSIACYALSVPLLFQMVRRLFDHRAGLLAVFFYSILPLTVVFTRTFQPDAMLALGSIAGVYGFWRWVEGGNRMMVVLSAVALATAVLIKPPSLYLGLPLLYLCYRRFGRHFYRKPQLWIFSLAVVVPAILWYRHAALLWRDYGNSLFRFYVTWGYPGFSDYVWKALVVQLGIRLVAWVATPAGLPLLAVGMLVKPKDRNYVLHWWAAGFLVYILLAPRNHFGHQYYQLPAMFLVAAWMAAGAIAVWDTKLVSASLSRAFVAVLCFAVVGWSWWYCRQKYEINSEQWDRVAFAEHFNRLSYRSALVVFIRPGKAFRQPTYEQRTPEGEYFFGDPIDLYLSHRKGWTIDEGEATTQQIESFRLRGARYLGIFFPGVLKRHPDLKTDLDRLYTPLEVTPRWSIYRLNGPAEDKPLREKRRP